MRRFRVRLILLAGAVGCSSSPSQDSPTKMGDERVSASVTANASATLLLDDGASLYLPPGAVTTDAEVTFSRETCEGIYASPRFQSCVYRVDTSDIEIEERFVLSLPAREENDAPAYCAAALTEDGWRCLVDAEVSEETAEVTASIPSHFTVRALATDVTDQRCTDPAFAPCGGELAGEWVLSRACGSLEEVTGASFTLEDPYEDCGPFEHQLDLPFSVNATLEFGSDGMMRTYETFSTTGHLLATELCLEQVGETCGEDCALSEGICDCFYLSAAGGQGLEDPWTYGEPGTFLYLGNTYGYCVEGDRLKVEFPSPSGTHLRVYERAKTTCDTEGCCFTNDDCPEDWFCAGVGIANNEPGYCAR